MKFKEIIQFSKKYYKGIVTVVMIPGIFLLVTQWDSRRIAEESGAFNKNKIDIFIGQMFISNEKENKLVFGMKKTEREEGLVIAPLTIGIKNSGDTLLENIYITYRYHEVFKRDVLEILDYKVSGPVMNNDMKKNFTQSGSSQYVTYHISSLNPSVSAGIDDPLFLNETMISDEVIQDGYTIPYTVFFEMKFQLSISTSTINHQDYDFAIGVISSESLDDLSKKYIKNVIQEEVKDLRSNSTFLDYLGILLLDNILKEVVLVYSNNEKIQEDKNVIFYPKQHNDTIYRKLTYNIAQWNKLF